LLARRQSLPRCRLAPMKFTRQITHRIACIGVAKDTWLKSIGAPTIADDIQYWMVGGVDTHVATPVKSCMA
jgi:hypothetical protein